MFTLATLAPLASLVGCETVGSGAERGEAASVMTAERQLELTPNEVLADLKRGNDRFVSGAAVRRDLLDQAEETAAGQYPKAIVLGCLDSRVPPEVVFDQGIGDLFVGRVAGNFENVDMLGSFEFGTKVAGAKLIVVLGHTSCGAVKGAIDQARLGNLTATLENIEPAVREAMRGGDERSSSNEALVNAVIEANVRQTVSDILDRSEVIADLVESGDLRVVGAVYDLESGRVDWLDG